jgi:hypothetical protein
VKNLTTMALAACACLIPAAAWAQDAPSDAQIRAAALAAAKTIAPVEGAGTLHSMPLPEAPVAGTAGAAMLPNFITVGEYLGPFLTPCFGCLTTTTSPYTTGLTLPMAAIPSGVPSLQFTYMFENMSYTGQANFVLMVMQGTKVVMAKAFAGGIYPSIWAVDFNEATPAVTGNLKVFGFVLYGTFNPKSLVVETPLVIQ